MRRKMMRIMTSLMLCLVMLLMQMINVPGIGSMILVAEAASEEVLYEQNFDSYSLKEGANDNGWYFYKANTNSTSTVTIEDGKMVFDAHSGGYDIVYLYQDDDGDESNDFEWSNYTLEADITYLKEAGWCGLAYNVRGGKYLAEGWHLPDGR